MGAIAEAIVAYTQPLIDATDGSMEQLNKALALGQLCFNLAVTPDEKRHEFLASIRQSLEMSDDEFEDFQRSIVIPMIRRHEEMFPRMHNRGSMEHQGGWMEPWSEPTPLKPFPPSPTPTGKYPGTRRNARCPCNSGRKYKVCCGR